MSGGQLLSVDVYHYKCISMLPALTSQVPFGSWQQGSGGSADPPGNLTVKYVIWRPEVLQMWGLVQNVEAPHSPVTESSVTWISEICLCIKLWKSCVGGSPEQCILCG